LFKRISYITDLERQLQINY